MKWQTHPWVGEGDGRIRFDLGKGPIEDWRALAEFVALLEELKLDSYWLSDPPMFAVDCWTTLAAVAAITRRIRLGSLVSCVYFLRSGISLDT
jgi:alkanesulfonate monooxygenase SsuD/methylene tetrahydromethanopterin reductase-like flavin-dependent oxidoreductase (luciferase family)